MRCWRCKSFLRIDMRWVLLCGVCGRHRIDLSVAPTMILRFSRGTAGSNTPDVSEGLISSWLCCAV